MKKGGGEVSIIHLTNENREIIAMQYDMKNRAVTNDNIIQGMKIAVNDAVNDALTDRQRQILFLYYYDEKSMPEIADQLGITKQNVSKSIKRSLTNLKKSKKIQKFL